MELMMTDTEVVHLSRTATLGVPWGAFCWLGCHGGSILIALGVPGGRGPSNVGTDPVTWEPRTRNVGTDPVTWE